MPPRQKPSRPNAGSVHRGPVDDRVGPCKINVFEHAQGTGRSPAVAADGADPVAVRDHDLPRVQIPDEPGSDGIQGTGLGSKDDPSLRGLSHAQRPEAMWIPRCQEF